ncbi:MAG TPA: peptidylprolyl isomerase [Thermoanaerobaculia bacterium]|nr:peptidylprolyl isomerase [Thermoanaerobaculia bacterium]
MKRDISIALVAILIVFGVTFALAKAIPQKPLSPSAPFVPEAHGTTGGAAKKIAANDKVVMRINGEPITEREFVSFMSAVPEEQRPMFASSEGRKLLAQEIVRMKALEQEGKRLGVADDPETSAKFELLRAQLTAQRALQKIVEEKAESRIRAEYEKTKNDVKWLRHIVIAYDGSMIPPRDGQPRTVEAATAKANAIVAKLRGGMAFAPTAAAESDDPESGRKGGSLGPFNPQMQMPPEILAAVTKLQPGQISPPVRTQFGVHIFTIGTPTLDDMHDGLMQRVQQQVVQEEVQRLANQAKVEYEEWYFPPQPASPRFQQNAPAPRSNG